MRFILVRHPETIANKNKIIYGWSDYDYTEKGEKQFHKVIESLKDEKIDQIYCSSLNRAKKLGTAIAESHDMPINVTDTLKEMHFGIFEDMTYDEIQGKYEKQWSDLISNYETYKIPEGESASEVYDRVTKQIESIKGTSDTCLIVAHGMVIQFLVAYFLGLTIVQSWRFRINPATIIDIVCKENYNYLQGLIPTDV